MRFQNKLDLRGTQILNGNISDIYGQFKLQAHPPLHLKRRTGNKLFF